MVACVFCVWGIVGVRGSDVELWKLWGVIGWGVVVVGVDMLEEQVAGGECLRAASAGVSGLGGGVGNGE